MTDDALFTLRELARRLKINESTARYYRDAFAAHLPTVGSGRRRLYPATALNAFRVIATGFANGDSRSAIEASLAALNDAVPPPSAAVTVSTTADGDHLGRDDVVAAILDGERERREAMWQMAREMFRLGEAIERQQVLLNQLAERVATADRALPAPASTPPGDSAVPDGTRELAELRAELETERELVERLRRSKLEIERRAAEAEARLDGASAEGHQARRSLLDRLLMRD